MPSITGPLATGSTSLCVLALNSSGWLSQRGGLASRTGARGVKHVVPLSLARSSCRRDGGRTSGSPSVCCLVPGSSVADRDVQRHRECVRATHSGAHYRLNDLLLAFGDLEHELVVHLQQQPRTELSVA